MRTFALSLLACAPLLFACEAPNTSHVETVGLQPDFVVTAAGDGSTLIRTELRLADDPDVFVSLQPGDRLIAHSDTEVRTLERRGEGSYVWYDAEFPTDRQGTEFRIELFRADELEGHGALVQLPGRFALHEPRPSEVFELSTDVIPIVWEDTASEDATKVIVSGPCIHAFETEIPGEKGELMLHPGTLVPRAGAARACDVDIQVERIREGQVDEAFTGGRISARQVRFATIRIRL